MKEMGSSNRNVFASGAKQSHELFHLHFILPTTRCQLLLQTITVFCLLLLPTTRCFSQEDPKGEVYQYARKIVDTLASPSMHGRGYVNGGDSIAAVYLKKEFAKLGVKPIGKEYYQRFAFPVNTFPNKMLVEINGKKLIPGKDFIVNPNSYKRKYKTKRIAYLTLMYSLDSMQKFENEYEKCQLIKSALFIDKGNSDTILKYNYKFDENIKSILSHDCSPTIPVIVRDEKLTWDVSLDYSETSFFIEILKSSLPAEIKKVKIDIKNKFFPQHKTQNIIGYIPGTQFPDSFIVYTAHYDHLGQMGKDTYFPGANDNASGCAMLLNLAKYYSAHPPKYSIAVMAFAGEEAGLLGSSYYAQHPLFPLKQIKFLINFDIVGTGDEGIKVVNATEFPLQFKTLQVLNSQNSYLKEVQPRGTTMNSDHYPFYSNGVKCFFIYTLGGIKAYHDIYDKAETLPLTKFEDLYKLMIDFTDWLQSPK